MITIHGTSEGIIQAVVDMESDWFPRRPSTYHYLHQIIFNISGSASTALYTMAEYRHIQWTPDTIGDSCKQLVLGNFWHLTNLCMENSYKSI